MPKPYKVETINGVPTAVSPRASRLGPFQVLLIQQIKADPTITVPKLAQRLKRSHAIIRYQIQRLNDVHGINYTYLIAPVQGKENN